MQCDLHIATSEWTANLVQVSHTVSPPLTDTYLLIEPSVRQYFQQNARRRRIHVQTIDSSLLAIDF